MGLRLAFKVFFKALKDSKEAERFLREEKKQVETDQDQSHLRLLTLLQQSGRLIDFFKEDISDFSDAQVGAAVRKIHADCANLLEEIITVRPIMEQPEGTQIHIQKGFDSTAIKIIGKIKGEPPYTGILVHRGWKAHKRSLPKKTSDGQTEIIHPAEVEVK